MQYNTGQQKSPIVFAWLCLALLLLPAGCSKVARVPGLVKCEGTVTWNGTPVEGATVTFYPQHPNGRGGVGMTDAKGKFKTTTLHVDDGIEPGEYIVTVTKRTTVRSGGETPNVAGNSNDREDRSAVRAPDRSADTYHVPHVYSDKKTSGLTAVVPAKGIKDLLFELVGEITNEPTR
jgi:hypothetical protein